MAAAIFIGKNETQQRCIQDPPQFYYRFYEWELQPPKDPSNPHELAEFTTREITFELNGVDCAKGVLIYKQIT